jgi:uncharacterized protein (DUF2147 family)
MKKILTLALTLTLFAHSANAARPQPGFFKTVDENTGRAKVIVRLYECGEHMCGRIVALFAEDGVTIEETIQNPVKRASKVKGNPFIDGLDIIWGMEWHASRSEYRGGSILDPQSGRVFSSRMWHEDGDKTRLSVRGSVGPFGRTQTWNYIEYKNLPVELKGLDVSNWEPILYR